MSDPRSIALAFAAALDADDFEAAGRWLAPDCRYFIHDRRLDGRAEILASYAASSARAKETLDGIEYASAVVERDGTTVVAFTDRITKSGRRHEYRCEQELSIEGGAIVEIRHRELDGERERLDAFLAGVSGTS